VQVGARAAPDEAIVFLRRLPADEAQRVLSVHGPALLVLRPRAVAAVAAALSSGAWAPLGPPKSDPAGGVAPALWAVAEGASGAEAGLSGSGVEGVAEVMGGRVSSELELRAAALAGHRASLQMQAEKGMGAAGGAASGATARGQGRGEGGELLVSRAAVAP